MKHPSIILGGLSFHGETGGFDKNNIIQLPHHVGHKSIQMAFRFENMWLSHEEFAGNLKKLVGGK